MKKTSFVHTILFSIVSPAFAARIVIAIILLFGCKQYMLAQDEFYHPELDWKTIETKHFYINFHDGAERTAQVIARIAEDIYEPVTSLYNHEPDTKVSFVVKDYDDYSNGAAYFFDNKIEIWAPSLDFDLRGTHNWLRNVITHEFTHIIQIQTSMKFGRKVPGLYFQWLGYESERRTDVLYGFPNVVVSYPISGVVVPSWFAEGVSQYNRHELRYDYWDSHRDMILRMYALDGNMLTWDEMGVFGKTSLGNESAYNAGFAFVSYIADRYGEDKIPLISRNLSSFTEMTIDGAIERALGKSGRAVYDEWRDYIQRDYKERTKSISANSTPLDTIGFVGFGNFYPSFSPDGKTLAYVSNKESDYFGQSAIYAYDLATKKEKLIKTGVRTQFSWSLDGKKMYYSRISRDNPHWSNISDLYEYDIEQEDETRLTFAQRASSPALSPDGKTLAFVGSHDGTLNLFTCDVTGKNVRQVTTYVDGEQVYHPKWSPDGKNILFDYSIKDGRDIAIVSANGGEVTFLLQTPEDERDGTFNTDGSQIIFSSDKTGIANLYKLDLTTKNIEQLSNILGGAYMPALNQDGAIALANYTSSGYKMMMMKTPSPLQLPASYVKVNESTTSYTRASDSLKAKQFDWAKLRSYDDTKLTYDTSRTYRNIASSLSFIPFIRVDNYNPKNKGTEVIKPGLYMYSYDVLERVGFFASAAMNTKLERDLFLNFDYRGKIPGLFDLGFEPATTLQLFNITRTTDAFYQFALDTIPVEVSYNLLEFDLAFNQKVFNEAINLEVRYAHSRYTGSVGSVVVHTGPNHTPVVAQSSSNLYFIGNNISANLELNGVAPSRTMEINPIGRKVKLKYEFEFSKFNPDNNYEVKDGLLLPKYETPSFHRLELNWKELTKLPAWGHTLTTQVKGGTIFGPPVDDFFNYYIGGLAGMKGYPFYALGGNEYLYGNITYRFPISDNIDVRVQQLYFDKLYAAIYGDVGNVWTGGSPTGTKFKKDIGLELRLEAFSYYAFPTRIFFNATYGLDQFDHYISGTKTTVTYGKEWQYHFGILFGFDFD